jgi:hypothetical protein
VFRQVVPVQFDEFCSESRLLSHAIPERQKVCEISVWMVSCGKNKQMTDWKIERLED